MGESYSRSSNYTVHRTGPNPSVCESKRREQGGHCVPRARETSAHLVVTASPTANAILAMRVSPILLSLKNPTSSLLSQSASENYCGTHSTTVSIPVNNLSKQSGALADFHPSLITSSHSPFLIQWALKRQGCRLGPGGPDPCPRI